MDEVGAGIDPTEQRANILLVDDKSENLIALEAVLADLGQNLVQATSAREALRHLLIEDFALILLDVQMPGLSGFELAELIRERERTQDTPIIFISATSTQEQFIFKGYSLGAVDYLTKPIEPEILRSKVRFFTRLFLQQEQIRRQARKLSESNLLLDEANAGLEERVSQRTRELEKANRELEAEVAERRKSEARLAAEHAITRSLALAPDTSTAMSEILKAFIEHLDAAVAARWEITGDGRSMICSDIESAGDASPESSAFANETKRMTLSFGEGLPGRVWAGKAPLLLEDPAHDLNFPRALSAGRAGLRGAVGFPIRAGGEICGVIEYFCSTDLDNDEKLLEMLEAVGSEIGQFLQRKQIEDERERLLLREKTLREEAENANRMKDEFLATLSHELRTPLNSILGWSQIILSDMVDGEGLQAALETIHRNATAQAQLIEELLEASRLITGKILLNLEPTELVPIINAAVDMILPRAAAKSIEIRTSLEPEIGTITSDSTRLQQMIWNLLTNALKFTPSGGIIAVRTERTDKNVRIIVSDTGIGIEPEFLPYVFERFRQQDSTSTRRHDGLGLGLAIVRQLAELHGGTVSAESEGPNKGSTFVISLPLIQAERVVNASDHDEVVSAEKSVMEEPLKDLLIHVVDDDEDSCNLLEYAFRLRGARVNKSNSASDAYQLIKEQPPDVLLADINMPEEDGYSLIKKVRALASSTGVDVPAIALTAMARAEDSERAIAAGFQVHVPKPVEIDVLTNTIRDLLQTDRTNGRAAG